MQYTKIQEIDNVLRVVAIENFDDVKIGDIGGVVTKDVEIVGKSWVDYDSVISGNIRIVDSKIYSSTVSSETHTIIEDSIIEYSTISESLICDSTVQTSIVKDSNIIDNAYVEYSTIDNSVLGTLSTYRSTVKDSRVLIDCALKFVQIDDNDFLSISNIKPFDNNIIIAKSNNNLTFILDRENLTKDELLENVKLNLEHQNLEVLAYIKALSSMLDSSVIMLGAWYEFR